MYEKIADGKDPAANYALAQLLGQVSGDASRDMLVRLLSHENSIVQGEAVRQLSDEDPAFVGEILLAHLDRAGAEGRYPSNVMDPVTNEIDGGKIEIIRTLGMIKYKPAAEKLLPLLTTDDEYLFKLLIKVLIELDNKDFVSYINDHLNRGTKSLIFELCEIITDNDLVECIPALMTFVSTHDRNDHPTHEYAISKHMGLAHFDSQGVRDFLVKDFETLLSQNVDVESSRLLRWIGEYIQTFKDLECAAARPLIYKSLFYWFGFDQEFAKHPELIKIKMGLEDSINVRTREVLADYNINHVRSLVHIRNTVDVAGGAVPRFDFIVYIALDKTPKKNLILSGDFWSDGKQVFSLLKEVKKQVSESLGVPMDRIGAACNSYVDNPDDRTTGRIDYSPMSKFYQYAIQLPNKEDLEFLKGLAEAGFAQSPFDKRQLDKTVNTIEAKLR